MSSPRRTRSMKDPTTPPSKSNNNSKNASSPLTQTSPIPNIHHQQPQYDYDIPTGNETGTSFSPSKARAQAKATHQITVLKNWLGNLLEQDDNNNITHIGATNQQHGPFHPLIARWANEYVNLQQQPPTTHPTISSDTVRALQDLMLANQAANSHRFILHTARREELNRLLKTHSSDNHETTTSRSNPSSSPGGQHIPNQAQELLGDLDDSLTSQAETSLSALAEVAVLLGYTSVSTSFSSPSTTTTITSEPSLLETLSTALMTHTSTILDLSSTIASLRTLLEIQQRQLRSTQTQLATISKTNQKKTDEDAETLQAQTSQWQREAKLISLKIVEYNDRIATLMRTRPGSAGNPGILVEDIVELKNQVQQRRQLVNDLKDRVKVFRGLPADLEASRQEVKRARDELATLKQTREELFKGMVG